jgi:hypothetical protein
MKITPELLNFFPTVKYEAPKPNLSTDEKILQRIDPITAREIVFNRLASHRSSIHPDGKVKTIAEYCDEYDSAPYTDLPNNPLATSPAQ